MGPIIGWELLLVDDQGEGRAYGTRRYGVTAMATYDDEGRQRMRLVQTTVEETPERMEAWQQAQAGRRVR